HIRPIAAAFTATAVVARLLAARLRRGAHRLDLFLRAIAPIRGALGEHPLDDLGIAWKTLRLVDGRLVRVDTEPREPFEDRVDRRLRRTLAVGVLDAEEVFASMVASVEPRVER